VKRAIGAFGAWFASAAGIVQTAVLVAGWIALEKLHVIRDSDGYQILYWLTVYSAVTQPVLAYVGAAAGRKTDEVLARLEASEAREIELLELMAGRKGTP
jgi:hypothetical protein